MKLQEVKDQWPHFNSEIDALARQTHDLSLTVTAFRETLRYLLERGAYGGCHEFSAIMYVLFAEAEALVVNDAEDVEEISLCIGVVATTNGEYFDHSWVEAGSMIYDVAVCLPNEGTAPTDGPVFASHDLLTGRRVDSLYTALSEKPLNDDADRLAHWSLARYAEEIKSPGRPTLWETISGIASRVAVDWVLDPDDLRRRFGEVTRVRSSLARCSCGT